MKKLTGILFTWVLMLNSCISFSGGMIKHDVSVIGKGNAVSIDGNYECKGYDGLGEMTTSFTLRNFSRNGYHKFTVKSIPLDNKEAYELQFKFLKGDTLAFSAKHQVRLKNGFFMVDNYKSGCSGIPYLYGSCEKSQSRIGLTKDGNLLIQSYYHSSGGIFLFLWSGHTSHTVEKYRKIK
ncbi:hypothetical protein [Chryseobacterium sp. JK1]|uniref:hypothetical protein n=1 Tax=Chryseobacterium sp. JK1 TaxID=874294 RepID=UPI003D687D25